MNKDQYLYWLDPNNPLFEKEIVYREMYSRIGYCFHLTQMVEYNLANILSIEEFEKNKKIVFTEEDIKIIKDRIDKKFNELSKITFGCLKNKVCKCDYLKDIDYDKLEKIVGYRNYLAHNCFKDKLLKKEFESIDDVDKFVTELNGFETILSEMNDYLLNVFKNQKHKTILMIKNK